MVKSNTAAGTAPRRPIHISGGKLIVKVRGTGLELKAMNARELLITGTIFSVDLT